MTNAISKIETEITEINEEEEEWDDYDFDNEQNIYILWSKNKRIARDIFMTENEQEARDYALTAYKLNNQHKIDGLNEKQIEKILNNDMTLYQLGTFNIKTLEIRREKKPMKIPLKGVWEKKANEIWYQNTIENPYINSISLADIKKTIERSKK